MLMMVTWLQDYVPQRLFMISPYWLFVFFFQSFFFQGMKMENITEAQQIYKYELFCKIEGKFSQGLHDFWKGIFSET